MKVLFIGNLSENSHVWIYFGGLEGFGCLFFRMWLPLGINKSIRQRLLNTHTVSTSIIEITKRMDMFQGLNLKLLNPHNI